MSARVSKIWRHPIKAHGRETLEEIELISNATLPWDRAWAVVREGSHADGVHWESCGHFSRGAKTPTPQAISAYLDEATLTLTLNHPDLPELVFDPDTQSQAFLDWVNQLTPEGGVGSAQLVRAQERGMTDTPFPSISLLNSASHKAVEQTLGRCFSTDRWRGNFLLEGLAPWEEFEWIGKQLHLGNATLRIEERIGRCQATSVDTKTGRRDTDMLDVLKQGWGHTDFGVYAIVENGGSVRVGDSLRIE